MKLQLKSMSISLASLLFVSLLSSIWLAPFAKAESNSDVGFSALQGCMDADNASLNVVYLMDISKSMAESDKKKVRASMLASSLQLFYQVSKDSEKPLNFTFISFGSTSDTNVTIPWSPVNARNLSQQLARAKSAASNESSYGTDWYEGLRQAQDQIRQKQNLESGACFVLSWMTDGQIDLNPNGGSTDFVPQDRVAYQKICEPSSGLINWFRNPSNNVATIGALLSKNANKKSTAFNRLSMEEKSVRLFQPVIEGSGQIPNDVAEKFGLPSGGYECGRVTASSHLGKLVSSGQAADLAWQFLDLIAHLRNLNKADFQKNGNTYELEIDKSVGRLEVFTKGKNSGNTLSVKDSDNNEICLNSDKCRRTGNGNWAEWVVDIPGTGSTPGLWSIGVEGKTLPKIFLGSKGDPKELRFSFDPLPDLMNIVEGNTVQTVAKLVHEDGSAVSPSEFKNICVELTSPTSSEESECIPGVSLPIKFNAETSNDKFQVTAKYQFNSSQETGQITDVKRMIVKSNNSFAKLSCASLERTENRERVCRLNPIPNSHKQSLTNLTASVGEGNSNVTITGFIADDNLERAKFYEATPLNQQIEVTPEAPRNVQFALSNSKIKNGDKDVFGTITYVVEDASGQKVTSQLKVVFSLQTNKNLLTILIFYFFALLLGIGIPYAALIWAAKSAATFAAQSFRYLTFPIEVSSDGFISTKTVQESDDSVVDLGIDKGELRQTLSLPDSRELSSYFEVQQGDKLISIGDATLSISRKSYDPFAPIEVELEVPGSLVYSNFGGSLALETSKAEQSLVGLYFITASLGELEPIEENSMERPFDYDDTAPDLLSKVELVIRQDGFSGQITCVIVGEVNPRPQLQRFVEELQTSSDKLKVAIADIQELRAKQLEKRKAEQSSQFKVSDDNAPSSEGEEMPPTPSFE